MTDLWETSLPRPVKNALRRNRISTLEELLETTPDRLMACRGIGDKYMQILFDYTYNVRHGGKI